MISVTGGYRYSLRRIWADLAKPLTFRRAAKGCVGVDCRRSMGYFVRISCRGEQSLLGGERVPDMCPGRFPVERRAFAATSVSE